MASGPRATGLTAGDEGAAPEFDAIIALPFGPFGIRAQDGAVRELVFLPPGTPLQDPRNATAGAAAHALREWIDDPDQPFPVPRAQAACLPTVPEPLLLALLQPALARDWLIRRRSGKRDSA